MKKLIPVIAVLILFLTSCGSDYDINGTYVSKVEDMDFSVVICDDFCMIDVVSTNENGETASVIIDGKVSVEDEKLLITIDDHPEITGNKFEFVYDEDNNTLTNTSDNSVLKKTDVKSVLPAGAYTAKHDSEIFELVFEDSHCMLTVNSKNYKGQTATAAYEGTASADGNIIILEFSDEVLSDDVYRFIYDVDSDVFMNTSDGHIFEKVKEN